jgi:Divergent InlB B-repeat domain
MRARWLTSAALLGGILVLCGPGPAVSREEVSEEVIVIPEDFDTNPGPAGTCPNGCKVSIFRFGQGTVLAQGVYPGGNCPPNCSGTAPYGGNVHFSAYPLTGYQFAGWGGNCGGLQPSCGFVANSSILVIAKFKKIH